MAIRVTPDEAVAQMNAIRGHLDDAASQTSTTASAGIDSRIASALRDQVGTSHQLIGTASTSSSNGATAARALGDQDERNRGKVDAVKTDAVDGANRGKPTDPRLPGDRVGASALDWKPGDQRRKPYLVEPGALGPPVNPSDPMIEVGPRSGVFVPKNELPGVQVNGPGELGPPVNPHNPYIELVPGSGVWAPKADFPGAKFLDPGELGPATRSGSGVPAFTEWLPGSGIWMPTEQLRP